MNKKDKKEPDDLQTMNFALATFAGLLGRMQNTTLKSEQLFNAEKYERLNAEMETLAAVDKTATAKRNVAVQSDAQ